MITHAFLQRQRNGQLDGENASLARSLQRRGYPVTAFAPKQLYRRQLPLNRTSLVAGEIPIVLSALKQLNIPPPKINDYPESLTPFLHRQIWRSSLGTLIELLEFNSRLEPIFAKPASRRKQFTGKVFASSQDLGEVAGVSRREEIFCSEVVCWLREYRIYIVCSQIRGIHGYTGDLAVEIDRAAVVDAIARLDLAGESLAGYSLDFGVLETGETAPVEMNEGFALGNYGLSDEDYTDLILARWQELLANSD